MRVILTAINAKYIHSGLAVYTLKANAREYREEIEIKEFTINNKQEEILQELYYAKPDILAFSCYIWNIELVKSLILDVAKILPDTHIWLGGPEVSYNANAIMHTYPMIKGIMKGEGEYTFYRILDSYYHNTELNAIGGLVFRENNGQIIETNSSELMNLSDLAFAYDEIELFENRIIYYESSRGCPFSCSYCLSSIDRKLRFKSIEQVKNELDYFLKHKVRQVKFVDRTFNSNKSFAIEIWKFLLEYDNGVTNFHFEIAADLLDQTQLDVLGKMRKGLVQFEIGVQSTNRKTIEEIDRVMDLNILQTNVIKIKSLGNIHQHLDLIVGLPYENYESFRQSFNFVYRLSPDQLQLGFLKVLRGSKISEKAKEYGIGFTSKAPYEVLNTNWITYEEVCRLKAVEEMVEIYYNSGQFVNTMKCLERLYEDPFTMFENISNFLRLKGKFIKHSRVNYYNLLLEFIEVNHKQYKEVYRELLTYDLYLRENVKSRPGFSRNLDEYKEKVKQYYQGNYPALSQLNGYECYQSRQIANIMHIEIFKRNIQKYVEEGNDDGLETALLFDYKNKDILSHSAATYQIQL